MVSIPSYHFFSNFFDFSLDSDESTIETTASTFDIEYWAKLIGWILFGGSVVGGLIWLGFCCMGYCCKCCYRGKFENMRRIRKGKKNKRSSQTSKPSRGSSSNSNSAEISVKKPKGTRSSLKTATEVKGPKASDSTVNSASTEAPESKIGTIEKEKTETTEETKPKTVETVPTSNKQKPSEDNLKKEKTLDSSCKTAKSLKPMEKPQKNKDVHKNLDEVVPEKKKGRNNCQTFGALIRNFCGDFVVEDKAGKKKVEQPATFWKNFFRQRSPVAVYWDVYLNKTQDVFDKGRTVVHIGEGHKRGSVVETHNRLEFFKSFKSKTIEFCLFAAYKQGDAQLFLRTVYVYGMVVVNGFDTYENIAENGVNRFWPAVKNAPLTHDKFTVTMVDEDYTNQVYYARLEVGYSEVPGQIMTIFLHILTSEWHGNLIKVEDAVNFYKSFNDALVLTKGNVVFFGDQYKSVTFIAIMECFAELCRSRINADITVQSIYENFPGFFEREEQFVLIFLALIDLVKKALGKTDEYSWITDVRERYENQRREIEPPRVDVTQE